MTTTTPSYQFSFGGNSYSGAIPARAGAIKTGTKGFTGRVGKDGGVSFKAIAGDNVSGQVSVATNVSLANFSSISVNDLLSGGTEHVAADNVAFLSLSGAATDTVAVTASGAGAAEFYGLAGASYAIANGAHSVEVNAVGQVYVHGIGSGGAAGSATVTEDSQATKTIVANLGAVTLGLKSSSTATPDVLQASAIGTLDVTGTFQGGLKLEANGLGTVDITNESYVGYVESHASADLSLNDSGAASGKFVLAGGNETVDVTQGFGTLEHSGQSAFTFDLRHAAATGSGDSITFTQNFGAEVIGTGAHDATFLLGAGSADITINGSVNPSNGILSRIAFIGGSGAATIHGGVGGSDVKFGTGTMDVTGGSGQNDYTFGAYGTSTTLDTIEDFKVGTDVLSLSTTVEGNTTFTDEAGGTAITFGKHTIDLVGVHGFGASNVNWTAPTH